jgi:hypothetical protein
MSNIRRVTPVLRDMAVRDIFSILRSLIGVGGCQVGRVIIRETGS